jgi:microcystin-dependent protein
MKLPKFVCSLCFLALSLAAVAVEGPPPFVHYQGTVLDEQGDPLAPAGPSVVKMAFRVWDAQIGGALLWSEEQMVTVSNGQFSVNLGQGTAIVGEPNNLTAAFSGRNRFLGITLGASVSEISPRLAFLSSPYAFVANTVTRVSQQPGTFSNIRLTSVGYETRREESGAVLVALTTDKRTNLIGAGPRGTVAQLPVAGGQQEILVAKTDASNQVVAIAPPANGSINGSGDMIRLKARGESVTLQNIGGNDWWIVKDTRDNTPVGSIIAHGTATPPPGYLACAGQSLSRDEYPDLFSAIGTSWGSSSEANGAQRDGTRFNLPDLSGRFLRGVDPNSDGMDDDAGLRTALFAGGNDGRNIGTYQGEQMFIHRHNVTDPGHTHVGAATISQKWELPTFMKGGNADGGNAGSQDFATFGTGEHIGSTIGSQTLGVSGGALTLSRGFTGITQTEEDGGGNETRPVNAAVRYCIKF